MPFNPLGRCVYSPHKAANTRPPPEQITTAPHRSHSPFLPPPRQHAFINSVKSLETIVTRLASRTTRPGPKLNRTTIKIKKPNLTGWPGGWCVPPRPARSPQCETQTTNGHSRPAGRAATAHCITVTAERWKPRGRGLTTAGRSHNAVPQWPGLAALAVKSGRGAVGWENA